MTIEDTRQLGIEFERRVQTMIPEKEYTEKLDSQTIYSFLNQYQDKYIHEIYRNLDKIPLGSKLSSHVESVLQSLVREETKEALPANTNVTHDITDPNHTVVSTGRSVKYTLDPSFYMYVRSVSRVQSSFSFVSNLNRDGNANIRVIPNLFVSQSDVWKLLETTHNTLRILRYPAAVLTPYTADGKPTLTVIYDQYTEPIAMTVVYYAQPKHFDIMSGVACELPIDAFEELVSGAVDLYVQYVAGAEANRRRLQEAQRQAAQQNNNKKDSEQ